MDDKLLKELQKGEQQKPKTDESPRVVEEKSNKRFKKIKKKLKNE